MKDFKTTEEEELSIEINPNNLKENEFFKTENYIPHVMIRVKRTISKGEEQWKVLENNTTVLILKSSRFTNKEKEFLRTQDGFNYIINGFKSGWRSINKFKTNLEL